MTLLLLHPSGVPHRNAVAVHERPFDLQMDFRLVVADIPDGVDRYRLAGYDLVAKLRDALLRFGHLVPQLAPLRRLWDRVCAATLRATLVLPIDVEGFRDGDDGSACSAGLSEGLWLRFDAHALHGGILGGSPVGVL